MTSEAILGRNLYALDALGERVSQVICQLPLRGPDGHYLIDDEAVRSTALTAQAAAKSFWRLGCAARAEIVRRIAERASDPAVLRREVAREAAEQHTSVRTFQRDAQIGQAFAPLFAAPDAAPDLDRSFYAVALHAPDPQGALALAAARKDADPFYGVQDFEAEIARARLADPAASYGAASMGCCGLAYLAPHWSEGVLETTEKVMALPLRRWLMPDAVVIVRTPPRALDLCMRILGVHSVRYQTTIFEPVPPYRDGCTWHEHALLLLGTLGKLRLPDGLPGTWRDRVERSIDLHFQFCSPKLVVYPRWGTELGAGWTTVDDLPSHVR